ncbi:MAG: NUDIX domain-containing protein [Sphingobacteriia bacterium]|nr:NUDIX domain-containing protein [Sphingobacteriia bacterium]
MKYSVRVGVGVIIFKEHQILLGKRINSHGSHTWGFPGGHLEYNEDPFECAIRETFEETGVVIKDLVKGSWTNDIFHEENKHYITLFILAKCENPDLQIKEPDRCISWEWFNLDRLPKNLFLPVRNFFSERENLELIRDYLNKENEQV